MKNSHNGSLVAVLLGTLTSTYMSAIGAFLGPFSAIAIFHYQGHNASMQHANLLLGAFGALLYANGIVGGWICDKWLGARRTVFVSLILMTIALILSAIPFGIAFFIGVTTLAFAIGLNSPIFVILGDLTRDNTKLQRDAVYTWAYLAMNIGAFASPVISAAWIGAKYGYRWSFISAAVIAFSYTVYYTWCWLLGKLGTDPSIPHLKLLTTKTILSVFVAIGCESFLLSKPYALTYLLFALLIVGAFTLFRSASRVGVINRNRCFAFLILLFGSVVFWTPNFIRQSALNFFAESDVEPLWQGSAFGLPWSFTLYQAFNPLFVAILCPISIWMWRELDKHHITFGEAYKFAAGVGMTGVGFLLLWVMSRFRGDAPISGWGLTAYYLTSAAAEMPIAPIGLSVINSLIRVDQHGVAVGTWFLGMGLASSVAGYASAITANPIAGGHGGYDFVFATFWVGSFIGAALLLSVGNKMNRWTQ